MDSFRAKIIRLSRDAMKRRSLFEGMDDLGIPALWRRFSPPLSELDAKVLCATYRLDFVRHVMGHSGSERKGSIRKCRSSVLKKLGGTLLPEAEPRSLEYLSLCSREARKLSRKILGEGGWKVRGDTRYLFGEKDRQLMLRIDIGTYRGRAEIDLGIPALGLRLHPDVLFSADLERHLVYTCTQAFGPRFENTLKLVSLFADGLYSVSARRD